jgi:hypothetical protein
MLCAVEQLVPSVLCDVIGVVTELMLGKPLQGLDAIYNDNR